MATLERESNVLAAGTNAEISQSRLLVVKYTVTTIDYTGLYVVYIVKFSHAGCIDFVPRGIPLCRQRLHVLKPDGLNLGIFLAINLE